MSAAGTSSLPRSATRSKGSAEMLVVGSRNGLTDFKHYANKHRARCAKQIVGHETVNQPSEGKLLAMARRYFQKYDLMAGAPSPV